MNYVFVFASLYGLFLLSFATSLMKNYLKARRTGLPIVVNPFDQVAILWLILAPMFQKMAARWMPHSLYSLIRSGIVGYDFIEGWSLYKDLSSPTYAYVTSSQIHVRSASPEFLEQVWGWKTGFIMDPMATKLLGVQGPNLMVVDGHEWQRQRKTIAPLLNERISEVVWNESLRQAHKMMSWVEEQSALTTNTLVDDVKAIAINVLGAAAYGSTKPWTPTNAKSSTPSTSQPFFDALSLQTQYFILAGLVPTGVLSLPFWPQKIRDVAAAKLNFSRYAQELIDAERASQADQSSSRSNVMAMLIKVLDQPDESPREKVEGSRRTGMSTDEVQGNLFILSIAGFETTANTMAYAFVLLAVYPEWQEWLIEEIDLVASLQSENVYGKTYPNLVRCLAFMFEVLRIYTPVGHTSRFLTSDHVVTLPSSGKTHELPAGLTFTFANQGVHLNPAVYGSSAEEFNPKRWILTDTSTKPSAGREVLLSPPKNTFLPWSSGPRVCPGMKMAQVEFVAVIFGIFKSYTVAPAIRHEGQSVQNATEKLKDCMANSRQRMTLMMNRPQDAWLSWKKR